MKKQRPVPTQKRIETLREYFEKGKAFTEELMRENERLRLKLLKQEADKLDLRSQYEASQLYQVSEENRQLGEKLQILEGRFREVAQENMDFANRYAEVQLQNENLMNLYVASYQLHSSLDPEEVVAIIQEIILNLIGAEEFSVYLKERKRGDLLVIAGEGPEGPIGGQRLAEVDSTLAGVLEGGEPYFRNGDDSAASSHLACTPLKVKGEVIGAISLSKLLNQKTDGLTAIDREILGLLSDHAATALVSADLHSRTERKLRTVESFIDLLTTDSKQPSS
jgi:nitrate/nitrite-specific signal transduction histidine kinase